MQQMPLQQQQQSLVYPASFQQHNTLLPTSRHQSTASLPLSHQQQAVSMPVSHQQQSAPLPPSHPQQIGYRSASFVDSNPAFQDLSESFKSLYRTVFETPQGLHTPWIVYFHVYYTFCVHDNCTKIHILWRFVSTVGVDRSCIRCKQETQLQHRNSASAAHVYLANWSCNGQKTTE